MDKLGPTYTPKSNVQQNKSAQDIPRENRVARTHARHSRFGLEPIDKEKAKAEFEEPLPLTTKQMAMLNELMALLPDAKAKPEDIGAKALELYHATKDRNSEIILGNEVRKLTPPQRLIAASNIAKTEGVQGLDLRISYFLKDAMEAATKRAQD
jgi:hypothetical protein